MGIIRIGMGIRGVSLAKGMMGYINVRHEPRKGNGLSRLSLGDGFEDQVLVKMDLETHDPKNNPRSVSRLSRNSPDRQ